MAQSGSTPPFPTTETPSEMRKKQKQEGEQEQQQGAASIPEGPLVEILSRVPYRSLCRFKCVSKPWLALCSDPQVRKRCPQTLSGFFHRGLYGRPGAVHFRNLSGRGPPMVDPSLPFLDKSYGLVDLEICCGGLVLCRCWKSGHDNEDEDDYNLVVCNPATEKWTELPPSPIGLPDEDEMYLGFDPAVPSRFMVFVHLVGSVEVTIYSSDTGRWTVVQSGWINKPFPFGCGKSVFLNGTMHLLTAKPSIVTVDTEGKVWREIDMPSNQCFSIGHSQGHLYAWYIDNPNDCQLFVWALEDYERAKWTFKHSVNILELFGRHCRKDDLSYNRDFCFRQSYKMFAIHPDRNLIFLTDGKEKTISYDMDNREVHAIGIPEISWCVQPYIPCFAEWPSDGH